MCHPVLSLPKHWTLHCSFPLHPMCHLVLALPKHWTLDRYFPLHPREYLAWLCSTWVLSTTLGGTLTATLNGALNEGCYNAPDEGTLVLCLCRLSVARKAFRTRGNPCVIGSVLWSIGRKSVVPERVRSLYSNRVAPCMTRAICNFATPSVGPINTQWVAQKLMMN